MLSFVFKEEYDRLPWGEVSQFCTLCGLLLVESEPYIRLYKEDPASETNGGRKRSLTQQFHDACFTGLIVMGFPSSEDPT